MLLLYIRWYDILVITCWCCIYGGMTYLNEHRIRSLEMQIIQKMQIMQAQQMQMMMHCQNTQARPYATPKCSPYLVNNQYVIPPYIQQQHVITSMSFLGTWYDVHSVFGQSVGYKMCEWNQLFDKYQIQICVLLVHMFVALLFQARPYATPKYSPYLVNNQYVIPPYIQQQHVITSMSYHRIYNISM
jgi:hypothetical protein